MPSPEPGWLLDLVEEWHTAPDDSPTARLQLHEHLGMTWDQYAAWVAEGMAGLARTGWTHPGETGNGLGGIQGTGSKVERQGPAFKVTEERTDA